MPPVTAQFLSEVTFSVNKGEIYGIIGAAGCGKSTLLQVIARRVTGQITGEVLLNEQILTGKKYFFL